MRRSLGTVIKRAYVFAQLAVLLMAPAGAYAAVVTLLPVGRDGPLEEVRVSLRLSTWYGDTSFEIEAGEGGFEIALDTEWLCSRWPQRCTDVDVQARLIVRARDRATTVSRLFYWPGTKPDPAGERVREAILDFPGHERVTVREDERITMRLILRQPGDRMLQVVDQTGASVNGARVKVSMFYYFLGRCGWPVAEIMESVRTNEEGIASVSDGDFEYLLELEDKHLIFAQPR